MAEDNGLVLMEANKTAHCPAFNHLMVIIKSGSIGEVVDIEASLSQLLDKNGRNLIRTSRWVNVLRREAIPYCLS